MDTTVIQTVRRGNRLELAPRGVLRSRGRRVRARSSRQAAPLGPCLLGLAVLLLAGLFLLVAGSRGKSGVPTTEPSTPQNAAVARNNRAETKQREARRVEEVLASVEKNVETHRFGDALVDLKDLSEKDLKPAQIERYHELQTKAENGFSILEGLRRAIRRNPGQLVELFEGRYRKILMAGDLGIRFVRPDRPSARERSMAWDQISTRGMIALMNAFGLVRTHPVETHIYLAELDHVIQDGQILCRAEVEARKNRLAQREKTQRESQKQPYSDRVVVEQPDPVEPELKKPSPYEYETEDEALRIGRDREEEDEPRAIEPEEDEPVVARQPVKEKEKEEKNEPARVENPERKEPEDEASKMKARGLVYFRGKWMRVNKARVLENLVKSESPQHTKDFPLHRFRITKPESNKWSFGSAAGEQGVFSLLKRDGAKTSIQISAYHYRFDTWYVFPGQPKTGGDNPSGILKRHQAELLRTHGGAKVRKRMWKDIFHKDMHPFRSVLQGKDGTVYELFSVPSNQGYADRTFVFIVQYAPGEYRFARHGVESIMKSFHVTDQ